MLEATTQTISKYRYKAALGLALSICVGVFFLLTSQSEEKRGERLFSQAQAESSKAQSVGEWKTIYVHSSEAYAVLSHEKDYSTSKLQQVHELEELAKTRSGELQTPYTSWKIH